MNYLNTLAREILEVQRESRYLCLSFLMKLSSSELWDRFRRRFFEFPSLGLSIDLSRMGFGDDYFERMIPRLEKAYHTMAELERGSLANPDERRMVGHYWLRAPERSPNPEITTQIEQMHQQVREFAAGLHSGKIRATNGEFKYLLVIGIGGSALGPQFVARALGSPQRDRITTYFFDNTDPEGLDFTLAQLNGRLGNTLCVVISKSGGTKETRNGMLEAQAAYRNTGLDFSKHAVAVTGQGSELDKLANKEGWLARFPMWDWVGGRTSETSAVGLLPAALQGFDIDSLLAGARTCDELTRIPDATRNPAAQLALSWFYAGEGRGTKDMVVIPYKDRLELFSRYLQQLIMESLGKEKNLQGTVVNQGLAVYGNKGSTDQHAYVQQLRDGLNNFFVTFIRVLKDREGESILVDPGVTSGDYLDGFLLGTRAALYDKGRESITITLREVNAFSVGMLIALFERAVGFYASFIEINAYHQPGVEAGKIAAGDILGLQGEILKLLEQNRGQWFIAEKLARELGPDIEPENVFHILEHLSANPSRGIMKQPGKTPFTAEYRL